jgi:hypothetical protein
MKSIMRRESFASKSTQLTIVPNTTATNGTQMFAASAGTIVPIVVVVYIHIMWPKIICLE